MERMALLAAFAVSGYSSTAGRTNKPFNPLLGETYELVHASKGFRAVVEKVPAPCTPCTSARLPCHDASLDCQGLLNVLSAP